MTRSETPTIRDDSTLNFVAVPGSGAVFLDVGRFIIDFDEGLVFLAGQHQFFEGDLEGLCAALP